MALAIPNVSVTLSSLVVALLVRMAESSTVADDYAEFGVIALHEAREALAAISHDRPED